MGIRIERVNVNNIVGSVYSARNAMNSWDKSDSDLSSDTLGNNDLMLAKKLVKAGSDHAKFRRMITVTVDVTAPLYWWKQMDQYRIGVTTNSCSTMHKIQAKEFVFEDFSCEHLIESEPVPGRTYSAKQALGVHIDILNMYRELYLETKDKQYWWQMIQLLPSSYNQKRTVMLNYETLANIYKSRRNHKLDEWKELCIWIKTLPYGWLITGENPEEENA